MVGAGAGALVSPCLGQKDYRAAAPNPMRDGRGQNTPRRRDGSSRRPGNGGGAFLAGGSVTDPAKGYHLELTTSHSFVSRETSPLIQEMLGVYPKLTKRGGSSVLYFKQSNSIEDFLTLLGAPLAAMGIMEAKLEKELKNKVNRRCNCDDANTSKVVDAAQEQLAAIRLLEEQGRLESLP